MIPIVIVIDSPGGEETIWIGTLPTAPMPQDTFSIEEPPTTKGQKSDKTRFFVCQARMFTMRHGALNLSPLKIKAIEFNPEEIKREQSLRESGIITNISELP